VDQIFICLDPQKQKKM